MKFNSQRYELANKKVLHKVKKQWVTFSIVGCSLLGFSGMMALSDNIISKADITSNYSDTGLVKESQNIRPKPSDNLINNPSQKNDLNGVDHESSQHENKESQNMDIESNDISTNNASQKSGSNSFNQEVYESGNNKENKQIQNTKSTPSNDKMNNQSNKESSDNGVNQKTYQTNSDNNIQGSQKTNRSTGNILSDSQLQSNNKNVLSGFNNQKASQKTNSKFNDFNVSGDYSLDTQQNTGLKTNPANVNNYNTFESKLQMNKSTYSVDDNGVLRINEGTLGRGDNLSWSNKKDFINTISFDGDVYLNNDSSYLFSYLPKLQKIVNGNRLHFDNATNVTGLFSSNNNLTSFDNSNWNTSNVKNMSSMFSDCYSLKSIDTSNWDTSNVIYMDRMFANDNSLENIDTSNWNTQNVEDMSWMFYNSSNLTSLDVSKWNTSNVTNMGIMFYGNGKLKNLDVSLWDTSNVTNMYSMFNSDLNLKKLDVSKWNTKNVKDMSWMFFNTGVSDLDVSKWNVSNVNNLSAMFFKSNKLNTIDVSNWSTDSATNMSSMFRDLNLKKLDVSNWNTSNVNNMSSMFYNTVISDIDVSKWDTSNVKDMSYMFQNSRISILDLSNFTTKYNTNIKNMMSQIPNLKIIILGNNLYNIKDSGLNSNVLWRAVGNGDISNPKGNILYTSNSLSNLYNPSMADTYVASNSIDVNSDSPKLANSLVNPDDSTGPKYPSGLSESNLNIKATRTIEYVDNNGKTLKSPVVQTVEYKRNAIVNFSDVNNPTVSYGSWMPADSNIDSYPAVTDLQIDGYVTNQKAVSSAKPSSNSENITVQVKYIPNKVTVDNVIKEGTPVDSNNPTGPKYPSGLSESDLNSTSTRTIEYVDNNGKTLKSPVVQTVEYKRNAIVNFSDVNNPTVSYGSWMPADSNIDSYPAVTDLQIDGYVTNQKAVSSAKPFSNSENITVQVKYIPNKVTVDNVIKEGTPVDSNNPTGPKYPSGLSESDLNSTSTRTIEYVDNNGKTLKSPVVQTVEYKRNAIVDFSDVNNPTVSYGSWMPADGNIDSYPAVTSPQIDGYSSNIGVVNSKVSKFDDGNLKITVVYTPIINSFYNERIDIYAYHFRGYTKPNTVKFYDDSNLVQFNNNLNSYKSENGSPMFKVLEKVHNSNGSTSYKVQMISKYTGRLSSKIAYLLSEDINKVLPLYYTNENRPNRIKVIGSLVCGYKNANLTGRKNIYNQGKILYVSSIVKDGLVYRLQLTNGEYITANRLYVSEVK